MNFAIASLLASSVCSAEEEHLANLLMSILGETSTN